MKSTWTIVGLCIAAFAAAAASGCLVTEHHDSPVPDNTVDYYDPCGDDLDCPGDTACFSTTIAYDDATVTDSSCTVECRSDFDCPYDGSCQGADAGPPLCYDRCNDDVDCPNGFACVSDVSTTPSDPVCVPF